MLVVQGQKEAVCSGKLLLPELSELRTDYAAELAPSVMGSSFAARIFPVLVYLAVEVGLLRSTVLEKKCRTEGWPPVRKMRPHALWPVEVSIRSRRPGRIDDHSICHMLLNLRLPSASTPVRRSQTSLGLKTKLVQVYASQ